MPIGNAKRRCRVKIPMECQDCQGRCQEEIPMEDAKEIKKREEN